MLKPNNSSADLPPPPYSPSSPQPSAPPMPSFPAYGAAQTSPMAPMAPMAPAIQFPVPHPYSPSSAQQQPPIRPVSLPPSNPHIPRDWPSYRVPPPPSPPVWADRRQRSGGCCKSWCKYLFLSLLIWLLVLKYIGVYQFSSNTPTTLCNSRDADYWDQLPSSFLLSQNVKVIVEGHVTGGHVRVNRIASDAQGTVKPRVRVSKNHRNLMKEMSFIYTPGPETVLKLIMPNILPVDGCVYVDMDISLADNAAALQLNVTNMSINVADPITIQRTRFQTTNGRISFDNPWEGESLSLQSSNGEISLSSLKASDTIDIMTTNGKILFTTAVAGRSISGTSSNGRVTGTSFTAPYVQLKTTNGQVNPGIVVAQDVTVTTSNGAVTMEANANRVTTHTTNGRIELTVANVQDPIVKATSSNSAVNLFMHDFKGHFKITTSRTNTATIKNDSEYPIQYTSSSKSYKEGTISSGSGSVIVATTNSGDRITFL
ncbi:hypothetical protein CLU79DRAFT_770213 [Phycomyces nitens]|nr:hypothetical protein CLU79DRAFT_770213 [Phycomyces nitens]